MRPSMQGVWSPSARAILDRATVLAAERRGRVATLDLLAAVLEGPSELARRLRSRGLRGQDLRAASRLHEEPTALVERVHARARALAELTAAPELLATHLLAAALAEPQSSLAVWAGTLGVDPVAFAEELARDGAAAVVRALPAAVAQPVARAAPPPARAPRPRPRARPLVRRRSPSPSVASRVKLSPLDARRVAPAAPSPPSPTPPRRPPPRRPPRRRPRRPRALDARAPPRRPEFAARGASTRAPSRRSRR
ncbi:MAG: hypothetical protein U0324_46665 [Polyangiales bacterium]